MRPARAQRLVRRVHGGVLDVYQRPYDPRRPLVGLDEMPVPVRSDVPGRARPLCRAGPHPPELHQPFR